MSLRHRKKGTTVKVKLTGKNVPMKDFLNMMDNLSKAEEKAQERAQK